MRLDQYAQPKPQWSLNWSLSASNETTKPTDLHLELPSNIDLLNKFYIFSNYHLVSLQPQRKSSHRKRTKQLIRHVQQGKKIFTQ